MRVYSAFMFPPILGPEHVFFRSLHLNHNPMVTVRGRVTTTASLSRLRHEQRTITVTGVTYLHDTVADAHAVVVMVIGAGDVRDRLRYAVLAVSSLIVAVVVGWRTVGQGVR